MKILPLVGMILGLFNLSIAFGSLIDPKFAIDPASPSIDGNITPDDVLKTGPIVFQQGTSLNLKDDFFIGDFDNLNALSYGQDPVTRPPEKIPINFSVDRVAIGLPGTAVNSQAQPGSGEAAGDVYNALPPFNNNSLFIDEEQLGLIPGFFGDDLDAVELDTEIILHTYFSIDFLSASNGFGALDLANDIFIDAFPNPFAIGESDIGLLPDDDLDALVLLDRGTIGALDPGLDLALFSLSTFSPSTFTFTGNQYMAGVQTFLSPADILFTDFTGGFELWSEAMEIGLFPEDEVDALDTIPEPGTLILLVSGMFGLLVSQYSWRT